MPRTILLIHGAWLTPAGWDRFRSRYESRGYTTLAPPWPLEDRPLEALKHPDDPELGRLTVKRIVDHYDRIIRGLPEAPIIIGHSYGGLFTQQLLDRGLGAAGVALDAVPIRGVFPGPRTLLSAAPALMAWRSWDRVVTMSYKQFATNFAQTLPAAEKRTTYDRQIIGTPGRLYWQAALSLGTGIHAGNPTRPPLLLVGGEQDRTITPSIVRATYRIQKRSPSATGLKLFPGRSHFLFAEPGWEEVADYALAWALDHIPQAVAHGSHPALMGK
jgi:pimeloyl-ACP methyl ester carboxylesterase